MELEFKRLEMLVFINNLETLLTNEIFLKMVLFCKKKKKIHVIAYKEAIVIIILIRQSLVTKFGCSLRLKLPLKN